MKPTILFLAANPDDTDQLALGEECAAIENELSMTSHNNDFEFHLRLAVNVDDLMRHLHRFSPTVLHFSGHGILDDTRGASLPGVVGTTRDIEVPRVAGIVLQDGTTPQPVYRHALAVMIKRASPTTRLVVLNTCYSAVIADSLSQVVDCVVGMEGRVEDTTARKFAVAFYRELGNRKSVAHAVEQARAYLAVTQQAHQGIAVRTREGLSAEQIFLTEAPAQPAPTSTASVSQDHAGRGYDLFLAHPPAIRATACALYELLQIDIRVFLAARSLEPTEEWDQNVTSAQRASRMTALLLSRQADVSWHLSTDVLNAIVVHRGAPNSQAVLVVLLEPGITVPRCLADLPTSDASSVGGLDGVAAWLLHHVEELQPRESPLSTPRTSPHAEELRKKSGSRGDHIRMYERLIRLSETTFEQLLLDVGLTWPSIAPRTARIAARALDVAQLAALDPSLSRRIEAALDKYALWTRR